MGYLKPNERRVLRRAIEVSDRFPKGFRPSNFENAGDAAICRTKLEPLGLVSVIRLKKYDFRYLVTDAGRKVAHE